MTLLRGMQERVGKAGRVAVLGGGAVGVQVASDVKGFYPEKEVVIYHSGRTLVPGFRGRLGEYVESWLKGMGVGVRLGERPMWEGGNAVMNARGEVEEFDLVVSEDLYFLFFFSFSIFLMVYQILTYTRRSHVQANVPTRPSSPRFPPPRYQQRPHIYWSSPRCRYSTRSSHTSLR